MKRNPIKFSVAGGLILLSSTSLAVPTKYNGCEGVNIQEPKMSSGFYFSQDCSRVYVLPPRIGRLRIKGHRATGHSDKYCESIAALEQSNANYNVTEKTFAQLMRENAERIEEINGYLESGLLPTGKSRAELVEEVFEYEAQSRKMRESILGFHEDYVRRMQYYAQREGSHGTFIVENLYSDLLREFQQKNKDRGLSFERIPLDQGYLAIVDRNVGSDIAKTEMPAVLEMRVPGIGRMPALGSAGQMLNEGIDPVLPENGSVDLFGSALSGEIRFSAIGYCGVEGSIGRDRDFSAEDVKEFIAANAFYEYQTQVERMHSLTFRMSELIRRIHEQTKKGGLLSRKTLNRLIDSRETTSWITFHKESNDAQFDYTDEYLQEVKREFIDRALRQIIEAKSDVPGAHLTLLDPSGKNGAEAIGDTLQKCPHLYCQIGASGFRVLSALFGSASATAELVKRFEGEISEVVVEKKMIKQIGTMTFE